MIIEFVALSYQFYLSYSCFQRWLLSIQSLWVCTESYHLLIHSNLIKLYIFCWQRWDFRYYSRYNTFLSLCVWSREKPSEGSEQLSRYLGLSFFYFPKRYVYLYSIKGSTDYLSSNIPLWRSSWVLWCMLLFKSTTHKHICIPTYIMMNN